MVELCYNNVITFSYSFLLYSLFGACTSTAYTLISRSGPRWPWWKWCRPSGTDSCRPAWPEDRRADSRWRCSSRWWAAEKSWRWRRAGRRRWCVPCCSGPAASASPGGGRQMLMMLLRRLGRTGSGGGRPTSCLLTFWLKGHLSSASYLPLMTTKNRDRCVPRPVPSPLKYNLRHILYPYLLE